MYGINHKFSTFLGVSFGFASIWSSRGSPPGTISFFSSASGSSSSRKHHKFKSLQHHYIFGIINNYTYLKTYEDIIHKEYLSKIV